MRIASCGCAPDTVRIETGAVTEHRAGDVQQAVGHRAQSAGVAMTAGSQRPVLVVADRIVLGGDPGPVVGGVAQPVVGCLSPRHDHALPRTAGDRSYPAETAKRVVVPPQRPVLVVADRIVLGGDPGPVVGGSRSRLWAACRRVTIMLFPERRVTGATPQRQQRRDRVAASSIESTLVPTPGSDSRMAASRGSFDDDSSSGDALASSAGAASAS